MKVAISLVTLVLIVSLFMQNTTAWRRRRRTGRGRRKREIQKRDENIQTPPPDRFCALHGEYAIKHGHLVPCDATGQIVDGLHCNKDFCWKGVYCWQCRLQSGSKKFEVVSSNSINNVLCEDVQCLYGNRDTGLEYYTSNSSQSIPLSAGPFKCNDYLCISDSRCWKCRLNDDTTQTKVIRKGHEFESKVSCCPLPKQLMSVVNSTGGYYKSGESSSARFRETIDDGLEARMNPSITIEFSAKELIVDIVLLQRSSSHFTVSYSNDGNMWTTYKEYSRRAIFISATTIDAMQRTLFKPLVARYLRIEPINDNLGSKVSVSIYGCEMSSAG